MLERTRECPRRMLTQSESDWIALHAHYKSGFLAVNGGVLEQPNAYLEAMRLIDQWVAKEHGKKP